MRYGFRMAFAVGLLAVTMAAPLRAADAQPAAEGVIQQAEGSLVTLKTSTGVVTVTIGDETKVHDGSAPLPKKVLRAGDVVVVQGTKRADGTIAATDVQLKPAATDKK